MDFLHNLIILVSRILICSLYLWAGWAKVLHWNETKNYMKSKNFPLIFIMLPAAIILQLVGGISLLIGFYCRVGALILIMFTIPAMLKMHNFWDVDGPMRVTEETFFMKDLAIVGGLLLLIILGAGTFSLDALIGFVQS